MKKIILQSLLFGLVVCIVLMLFTCRAINVPAYYRMAHGPGFAEGTVTNKLPDNHRHVEYSFSVNNQSYSGEGAVGDAFDEISPGDKVRVTYDPKDPSLSMLMGSASDIYKQATIVSAVFAILVGFPGGFGTFLIIRLLKEHIGRSRRANELS